MKPDFVSTKGGHTTIIETKYNQAIQRIRMPDRIKRLPVSSQGYPVPWFVAHVNGDWDFRVIGPGKIQDAVNKKKCWVCGQPLGSYLAFTIGPMCAINRTIAEPPAHYECARYSVMACPFLSNPNMRRNEKDLPADGKAPAGNMIKRNPTAICIWVSRSYKIMRVDNGVLFKIGPPENVEWYREGRPATRAEVQHSIDTGLPLLRDMAEEEGAAAVAALEKEIARVQPLLPLE